MHRGHHGWGRWHHGCCCGGHHGQHGHGGAHHWQHGCCCGRHHWQHGWGGAHPFGFHRRFSAREEEAAALEQYLKDLEAEAAGVRERLEELRQS